MAMCAVKKLPIRNFHTVLVDLFFRWYVEGNRFKIRIGFPLFRDILINTGLANRNTGPGHAISRVICSCPQEPFVFVKLQCQKLLSGAKQTWPVLKVKARYMAYVGHQHVITGRQYYVAELVVAFQKGSTFRIIY